MWVHAPQIHNPDEENMMKKRGGAQVAGDIYVNGYFVKYCTKHTLNSYLFI
jgi:hypothetical protein